jgi:uncharacterized protein (TIGR03382 family)
VVVVDTTYDHVASLPDSHFRVDPKPGTPANWKSPVDYSKGTAYVHLEVLTKPTDVPTKWQACFEATPTYGCVDQSPTYTKIGNQDWSTPFSKFYMPPGQKVDWAQGTKKIALILKDTANNKPSADNVGATKAAMYMPTRLRVVITLVSEGGTYVPPGPAEPADAGAKDAATDSSAPSTPPQKEDDGPDDAPVAKTDRDAGDNADDAAPSDGGCNTSNLASTSSGSLFAFLAALSWLVTRRREARRTPIPPRRPR